MSIAADPFQAHREARVAEVRRYIDQYAPRLRVADWEFEIVPSSLTELSGEGPESGHYTALAVTSLDRGTKKAVIRFAADYDFDQPGSVNGPLEHVIKHELAHLILADLGYDDLLQPPDPHAAQQYLDVKERLCDRFSRVLEDDDDDTAA